MKAINLPVDSRKRISLTKLLPAGAISSVKAYVEEDKIILEPMVEIPAREAWLYQNKSALKKVRTGRGPERKTIFSSRSWRMDVSG